LTQEGLAELGKASVSSPFRLPGSGAGLAQASQSAAGIWLTEDTASRVSSDDAIEDLGPVTRYDQPSRMVTNAKIVHCSDDFKGLDGCQVMGMIPKSGNRFFGKDHAQN
jgi:hypothetical protein